MSNGLMSDIPYTIYPVLDKENYDFVVSEYKERGRKIDETVNEALDAYQQYLYITEINKSRIVTINNKVLPLIQDVENMLGEDFQLFINSMVVQAISLNNYLNKGAMITLAGINITDEVVKPIFKVG